MANNKLFHAAALHRLFVLRKEQKKTFSLGSEEAQKWITERIRERERENRHCVLSCYIFIINNRTATQVLLATLSVPITPILSPMERLLIDDSTDHEKALKLSALLRIQTPPTRSTLLSDLVSFCCHLFLFYFIIYYKCTLTYCILLPRSYFLLTLNHHKFYFILF